MPQLTTTTETLTYPTLRLQLRSVDKEDEQREQKKIELETKLNQQIQENERLKRVKRCATSMFAIIRSYEQASNQLAEHEKSTSHSSLRLVEQTSSKRRTIFICNMAAMGLAGAGGLVGAGSLAVSSIATATLHNAIAKGVEAVGQVAQSGARIAEQGAHGFGQDAKLTTEIKLGPENNAQNSNKQSATETTRTESDLTARLIEAERNAYRFGG